MKKNKDKKSKIPVLDLHACRQADVYDRIEKFISAQTQKGSYKVHIMTGKGKGIVQKEAQRYLKDGGYTWTHEAGNTGIMVVPLL